MKIRGCGRWVGDALGSFAKISGLAGAFLVLVLGGGVAAASEQPDFGPNVFIFSPDMSQSEIQAIVNTVANQQVTNQFGTQREAKSAHRSGGLLYDGGGARPIAE